MQSNAFDKSNSTQLQNTAEVSNPYMAIVILKMLLISYDEP
jgi:hypothetical protein